MTRSAYSIVDRRLILKGGTIVLIKVWRLPEATAERPHGLKYSLFYGRPGGSSAMTRRPERRGVLRDGRFAAASG